MQPKLRCGQVEADDVEIGVDEASHDRDTGAAPGIEHGVAGVEAAHEFGEEGDIMQGALAAARCARVGSALPASSRQA